MRKRSGALDAENNETYLKVFHFSLVLKKLLPKKYFLACKIGSIK